MSRKSVLLAAGLIFLYTAGCVLPVVEGIKAAHLVLEGDFDEITPVAQGALEKYKGYKVGTLSWEAVTLPEDTKEADKPKAQEHLDRELKFAQEAVAILPDRFGEYIVDNAELHLNVTPCLVISVRDLRVQLRKGFMSVALPKAWVESIVTLTDAQTGNVLGEAKVYGRTSSRILGTPRHLANFVSRGTAKWINKVRLATADE